MDIADYVATVTLARPPVNAQNRRFREEIITIFEALNDRADVRAIVLTGEGKTFSAGADLKERPALDEAGAYPRHNRLVRESFNVVMECEKPVIAAINGAAIGAGCVLALCCDILIAADTAYLSMTEVDVGLAGGVSHVRRFFRESDARLLIYTARRVGGLDLFRMGVVSACVPLDKLIETAQAIARGNRNEESSGGPRRQAIVQRHRGHAVAGCLPLRAIPNHCARLKRRHERGDARLRRKAPPRLQELNAEVRHKRI